MRAGRGAVVRVGGCWGWGVDGLPASRLLCDGEIRDKAVFTNKKYW